MMENPFNINFPNGSTARAVKVSSVDDLAPSLRNLGIQFHKFILVLIGGASKMEQADLNNVRSLFSDTIIPLIESLEAIVIDGGTDAGIMELIGDCRRGKGAMFPLIGVSAIDTVSVPRIDHAPQNPNSSKLEPNHTHFVLVPGSEWGDESPWISRIADVLSEGSSSVTLVLNGGAITLQDVSQSINAKRPVIVLAETGRTADDLAAAVRGEAPNGTTQDNAESGLLKVVDLFENPGSLAQAIEEILARKS